MTRAELNGAYYGSAVIEFHRSLLQRTSGQLWAIYRVTVEVDSAGSTGGTFPQTPLLGHLRYHLCREPLPRRRSCTFWYESRAMGQAE